MYVKSRHARSVSLRHLAKVFLYAYINPRGGYYQKMRDRFGSTAKLVLNTELALHLVMKSLPGRQPGAEVLVDAVRFKRFSKVINRLGLKAVAYDGQRDLVEKAESSRVIAIFIPDAYQAMHRRYAKRFDSVACTKILYQNRKKPKRTEMFHDIYIWEPSQLPRAMSGAVLSMPGDDFAQVRTYIKEQTKDLPRLSNYSLLLEIVRALRGYENKFRRLDARPPRVLARILYDFYK